MLYPSIDRLMEKLDSKYSLVTLAAKRAREISIQNNSYIEAPVSHKSVGKALEEFVADYIKYEKDKTQLEERRG